MARRSPPVTGLFEEQHPDTSPRAAEHAAGKFSDSRSTTRSEPLIPEDERGSIVWYAKEQNRLREEGMKSASVWWAAKGIKWPT